MDKLPKRMWLDEQLNEEERSTYKDRFNQISGAEFIALLKEDWLPFIKSLGFKGTKNTFYKRSTKNDPWIYTVHIFKDKYGGNCALTIGLHLNFIETAIGYPLPVASKLRPGDAMISQSIPLPNGNTWYYYGRTEEEGRATIAWMKQQFEAIALPFFKQFESYPTPLDAISLEDVLNPSSKFEAYGIDDQQLDWVHFHFFLAKFNHQIGRTGLAIQLLEHAWEKEYHAPRFTKKGVSPLLKSLKDLLETYQATVQ